MKPGIPCRNENGFAATRKALELVQGLTAEDTVLFLLSGGGSALFEKPLIPAQSCSRSRASCLPAVPISWR